MTEEWSPGDRVQYDDYNSKFTAVLTEKAGTTPKGWRGVVDSIEALGDNCEGLMIGDRVIVVEGHSVKIND